MGWMPESGFPKARWEHYCELMMIYLLGIGSPTHPVPAETWKVWTRPTITFQGIAYISGNDPIFTHQYSHAWYDFRNKRDAYANYFDNSILATKAHKLFCLSLRSEFPDYSEDLWGSSASDYQKGYTAWGGPPRQGPIDGSIVPCATGGSLAFLFPDCIRVLRTIRGPYGRKPGAVQLRRRVQSTDELVRHGRAGYRPGNHHADGREPPHGPGVGYVHEEAGAAMKKVGFH
jgi:hypothetical protein